jgi:acylphosphatase
MKLFEWSVFEVTSNNDLQGVMFRGRLRKFALEKGINLLTENDEKDNNCVRFAILISESEHISSIIDFIKEKIDTKANVQFIGDFQNPVLSKLKVNDESRYTI